MKFGTLLKLHGLMSLNYKDYHAQSEMLYGNLKTNQHFVSQVCLGPY